MCVCVCVCVCVCICVWVCGCGCKDEESIKGIIQEARSLPEAKHRTPFHDLIEDEFNRLDIHSRDTIVHGNAHVVC